MSSSTNLTLNGALARSNGPGMLLRMHFALDPNAPARAPQPGWASRPDGWFTPRAAAAAFRGNPAPLLVALVIAGWQLLQPHSAVLGLPFGVAWIGLAAEISLGLVVADVYAQRTSGDDRRWIAGLLILGLAIVAGPVIAKILWHSPRIVLVLGPGTAAAGAAIGWWRPRIQSLSLVLVIEVLSLWVLADVPLIMHMGLYDFQTYLAAGRHALAGAPVYFDHALTALPSSASNDYFLYPPPLIPVFEVASMMPYRITSLAWVIVLVLSGVVGFRMLGLDWRWVIVMMAFPPLVKGINSGNVANLAFLMFAAGYRYGWTLVLGVFLKVQTVLPVAWLFREREWRPLLKGVVITVVIVLVSLPLVGIGSWHDWLAGLSYRAQSQVNVPILYGDSLALVFSPLIYVLISLAAIAVALLIGGRRGLAALGLAMIVASPTLWPHGFVVAIPALLGFESAALVWLALGLGPGTEGLWLMAALAAVALFSRGWMQRRINVDPAHPFSGASGPWPSAERSPVSPE